MPKATYQIVKLSASTNFLPINIAATAAGSATLIHTAHATNFDELWLRAYNYTANDAILYLCLGGTSAHQILSTPIPAGVGIIPVINGDTFSGGVDISAYASTTNSIAVVGRINSIVFI